MAVVKSKCINPLILLVMGVITIVMSVRIVPERCEVTYVNYKYLKYGKFYVRRLARRGLYYANVEGYLLHTWTNNVTLNLVFYEYLHNEYRRTFVQGSHKFCDLVNKEPYIGLLLRMHNVTCPTPPGEYRLLNLTVPMENFPNVWPFEKARVDLELTITDTKEVMAIGQFYASFVPDAKPLKRTKTKKKGMSVVEHSVGTETQI